MLSVLFGVYLDVIFLLHSNPCAPGNTLAVGQPLLPAVRHQPVRHQLQPHEDLLDTGGAEDIRHCGESDFNCLKV